MVRVGGLKYEIDPTGNRGERITYMELGGEQIDMNKTYVVAGWASVQPQTEGVPIWDVVSDYLRNKKVITKMTLNEPKLKGVTENAGYETL